MPYRAGVFLSCNFQTEIITLVVCLFTVKLTSGGFHTVREVHRGRVLVIVLDKEPLKGGDDSIFNVAIFIIGGGSPTRDIPVVGVGDPCEAFSCLSKDRKSTRLNSSHVAISYA